jgi:hypothetical protein
MLRETLFSELAQWTLEFKKVKPGQEVLICVSPDTDSSRYSALVTHSKAIRAIPHVLVVNTPKEAIGLWSVGRGVKLPRTVAAALKATDFIYWFCDFDPAFLQEIKDAGEKGVQFMFGWPPIIQEATWHIRDIDMAAVSARGKKWEEMLNKFTGKKFRLITDGEELTGTTKPFYSFGPGERKAGWTQGECMSTGFFSDANGVQNIDWIGVCSDVLPGKKARLTVEDGAIVKAEGELGEMFWKILQAIEDPNIYKMAELAVGMNPYTRMGVSALGAANLPMTVPPYHEVKMSQGTVHTAWGDSGGRTEAGTIAKLHIDTVSFKPTLYVAGKKHVEDGKLLY